MEQEQTQIWEAHTNEVVIREYGGQRRFAEKQMMWGLEPGVRDVLIPGVGYGRNAKLFLEHEMSSTKRR